MAIETPDSPVGSHADVDHLLDAMGAQIESGEIPLRIFNDQAIHDAEIDRVFGETWVFIGHTSEIPDPGDYAIRYIGNDPFIFTRDEDAEVQVLFNSCRHRGTRICRAEQGNTTHFRCPYHGWTYNNSGELIGVPKKGECFAELDVTDWGLHSAPRVESYEGLVFASLDPSIESLEHYLGDMLWYFDANLNLTEGGMEVIGEPERWRIDSNWKIAAENAAGDDYHTHITHKSALDAGVMNTDISWEGGTYYVTVTDLDGHTIMYRLLDEDLIDADDSEVSTFFSYPQEIKAHLNEDGLSEAQFELNRRSTVAVALAFPNFGFVHHASRKERGEEEIGFFAILQFRPISPSETEVWYWVLAPAEADEAYKKRAYSVGVAWDGVAGIVGQDDIAVFRGITESAGSTYARRNRSALNYQMGMEVQPGREPDSNWRGPGTAYVGHHDGHARELYESWYEAVSK